MTSISVILADDKYVVVLIPKKEAACLGVLLDACLDTVGSVEGRDVGLTDKQVGRAEDNMIALAAKLTNLGPPR